MTIRHVLSVDFGTTKTYFSKCPGDDPSPVSVDFGDGRDGVPTAILYRRGKPSLVGQPALDEYGEATVEERTGYRLRTNFKPDLARSADALACARDFLEFLLQDARRQGLDVDPSGREVLFGIPSESDGAFRSALRTAASDAGFGVPRLVEEPKGALLYHLKQKDLPVQGALRGILVADFGGGTCDFAFLEGGQSVHSWGDMLLGGRLFDDLFFQWLLDLNPNLHGQLEEEGAEYFVQSWLCREAKEAFSRTMSRDRKSRFSRVLPGFGKFSGISWEEFLDRGSAYRPSGFFLSLLESMDVPPPGTGKSGTDLFGWFRNCMRQGLDETGIGPERISAVILSGGSSLWPFVGDIIREELPLCGKSSIIRSDRPYAVISMGLALLPALKRKYASAQASLKKELPSFLENAVAPVLAKLCGQVEESISSWVTGAFFQKEIRPLLEEFRRNGGSPASLAKRIESAISAGEPRLSEIMERNLALLLPGLVEETRKLLSEWFAGAGIALPEEGLGVSLGTEAGRGRILRIETPAYSNLLRAAEAAAAGIMAAVTAMVLGGTGTALLLAGPAGFAVGGILGAAAGLLAARSGRSRLQKFLENRKLAPWAARFILGEGQIAGLRGELGASLKTHLESRLAPVRQELEKQVRGLVLGEIEALSEIHGF